MTPPRVPHRLSNARRVIQRLHDLSVGNKLYVGFGSLVIWMVIVVLLDHFAIAGALSDLERTRDLRLPSALASAALEREIHQMIGDVEGYLSLGEREYRDRFHRNATEAEELLHELQQYSADWTSDENPARLEELQVMLPDWLELTEQMFGLRDNPVANQPTPEGERVREELYVVRNQAAPLADEIVDVLGEMRTSQTDSVSADVEAGIEHLASGQIQRAVGAAIMAFFALILALAIRRDIVGRVLRLTDATTRIMHGNMDARARVESNDEIGRLAASFNDMADRMKASLVEAERRAQIIETSSQVSRRLSTILDQKRLMQEVVEQVKSAFDYHYARIVLIDEEGTHLVTAEGVGDTGRELISHGFNLELDQGLVGRAASTNRPVLAADVTKDSDYLPNPMLPETKAEIAVPIALGDQLLGVLDVQQNVVNGLSKVDLDVLQSIASQVAVTLVNARLYDETQQKAERERLINKINQKILGTTSVERAMQVAVREVGRAVEAKHTIVQLDRTKTSGDGNGDS